jgi:hypothetical protein
VIDFEHHVVLKNLDGDAVGIVADSVVRSRYVPGALQRAVDSAVFQADDSQSNERPHQEAHEGPYDEGPCPFDEANAQAHEGAGFDLLTDLYLLCNGRGRN